MMRAPVAILMAVLLLGVITVCPLLACPIKADSCHKSHSPCQVQNCPYFTLERGKTAPATIQTSTVALLAVSPEAQLPHRSSLLQPQGRIPDSTRLFLRVRVLLI